MLSRHSHDVKERPKLLLIQDVEHFPSQSPSVGSTGEKLFFGPDIFSSHSCACSLDKIKQTEQKKGREKNGG